MNYVLKTTLNPQFHCETEHLITGAKTFTDLSKEKGGKGSSFCPMELLVSALCSCMLSMVQYTAASRGVNICSAETSAAIEEDGSTISVHLVFNIPLSVSAEIKTFIEKAADHCPVHKTLNSSVKITTEWLWGS